MAEAFLDEWHRIVREREVNAVIALREAIAPRMAAHLAKKNP